MITARNKNNLTCFMYVLTVCMWTIVIYETITRRLANIELYNNHKKLR